MFDLMASTSGDHLPPVLLVLVTTIVICETSKSALLEQIYKTKHTMILEDIVACSRQQQTISVCLLSSLDFRSNMLILFIKQVSLPH
jgi:hypothetical protein